MSPFDVVFGLAGACGGVVIALFVIGAAVCELIERWRG